ncbi:putative quinol monooxygenase [Frigidibacter sp. ROC022]|uniref:putative quinol monooxygenase n=1 Tax=Frigidibacter sp. ROC022 TaxID=2971796 RepID=UPI00215B3287|nr:putative quinol monooxygenase [Frigidibacter sp. ROC022]MCR8726063.1 antibiotic biosynthesis monooxygenase [Frigidibacter sp. ROC022]
MFAVVVTFQIVPGQMPAFLPLMLANARASLTAEDGCHQFDVATDPERPDEVFLYELYTDKAAFDAHLDSPHFAEFNAGTAAMIAGKTVATYAQVQQ